MGKTVFTKDEKNATLTIERVFPAPRHRVWQAFTDAAILDQWWAPKPWKAETITMDFRVSGHWHYAMKGPDGETHYGRTNYLEIEPERFYRAHDVFADASGAANESLPQQRFDTTFTAEEGATRVVVVSRYASLADLEQIIAMGMQEGLTMAQDQLEALLEED